MAVIILCRDQISPLPLLQGQKEFVPRPFYILSYDQLSGLRSFSKLHITMKGLN